MVSKEWKTVNIGDCVSLIRSGLSRKLSIQDIGLPMIRSGNIGDKYVSLNDIRYWYLDDPQGANTRDYFLDEGDLLINFINSRSQIGKACIYRNELKRNCIYTTNILRVKPRANVLPDFLLIVTKTEKYDRYIKSITKPAVNQASFTIPEFKKFCLLLPPLNEQRKIVEILLDWDSAIEKTERLISIKASWFNRLLSTLINKGSEKGEWTRVKLGEVCDPITLKNSVGETNVLTSSAQHGLISQLEYYSKSVSAEDVAGYYLLKKGDFAYNRSSANGYPFGATKRLDAYEQGVLSTLYICFSIKQNANCNSDFLLYMFESGVLNRQLRGICQEGARSHGLLNITKADFFGINLFLPPMDTQQKIAELLNNARKEIDLLKKQLEALRKQKRGLMQKLLAGEWRVKTAMEDG